MTRDSRICERHTPSADITHWVSAISAVRASESAPSAKSVVPFPDLGLPPLRRQFEPLVDAKPTSFAVHTTQGHEKPLLSTLLRIIVNNMRRFHEAPLFLQEFRKQGDFIRWKDGVSIGNFWPYQDPDERVAMMMLLQDMNFESLFDQEFFDTYGPEMYGPPPSLFSHPCK
jgi:hypothetical protein